MTVIPCFFVSDPPALIRARVVCACQPNFLQIASSVAPSLVRSISISCAVLLFSRGPEVMAASSFFAAPAFLAAFTGLAVAFGARFVFGAATGASLTTGPDPPSFCTSAKIRLAAVAASLNFFTGVTPVRLFDPDGSRRGVILQRGPESGDGGECITGGYGAGCFLLRGVDSDVVVCVEYEGFHFVGFSFRPGPAGYTTFIDRSGTGSKSFFLKGSGTLRRAARSPVHAFAR